MLTKRPPTIFLNDNDQAQRSARAQLEFIINNKEKLSRIRNGEKYKTVAAAFFNSKEPFTPKQLSYIDVIYEKTFQAAGYEAFQATYKPSRN